MKKTFAFILLALLPVLASAHDAEIDGIYYNFSGNEATVTYRYSLRDNSNAYSGAVVIPASVTYNGKTYSVTSIGNSAFYWCTSLTSITIPNSVTYIGDEAFYNCSGLTSITIPNSVTSIGERAFWNCTSLTSVTIGSGVTSIGDGAFSDCSGLTSITIPNSVTFIGDYAFCACGLTSVTIPGSVTSIGDGAFSGCSGLTSVTIPNSVTSIGGNAFSDCSGLTSIIVESGNTVYDSRNNCNAIIETETNTLIAGCKNTIIPNSVTSIGNYAFSGCSGLTSVTIPGSVTSIGDGAFSGCSSLTSITIPNSVTSIGEGAFYGTAWYDNQPDGLVYAGKIAYSYKGTMPDNTKIVLEEGTLGIADYAFSWQWSLTSITIPNSVTFIGVKAFYNCSGLTSVTIPGSVTSIGDGAFSGCSSLTSITIPGSVTSIGGYAFYGCYSLTSVTIPNSVTSIGSDAFRNCSGLTSITIPNSVTSIGYEAFMNCSGLKDVWCYAENVPSTSGNAFKNSPIASATLHVPAGSVNSYKTTSPWSKFGTIVALPATYNLTYFVDGEVYKTYKVEEGSVITPEPAPTKEGHTFSGWTYIPPTMPAADVVVMGTFRINTYTLTYMVDGEEYKSYDVEYNAAITPEPEPTKAGYTFSGWSEIPETMPAHDVTVTGSFTKDKLGKCATPTISYVNGEVTFNSETEGVTFIYDTDIEDEDITGGIGNKIQFSVTYHISVYAQKEDYYDSEVATATLCWIDVEPATEGIVDEDAVTEVKALPVLIQTQGGTVTIQGAAEGTPIAIYDTSGKQYGSATSEKDRTTISTSLRPGSVAIVKIGEKAVKVLVK